MNPKYGAGCRSNPGAVHAAAASVGRWLVLLLLPVFVGSALGMQDFIVLEATLNGYSHSVDDVVVLDPEDGRILQVLPMTPMSLAQQAPRAPLELRLYPSRDTVVARSGQTLAHNRVINHGNANRRLHSYVWRMASGELLFTSAGGYGFALLGEEGDHLAMLVEEPATSVTEFQVWDVVEGRPVFAARFPEALRVRAHRTDSPRFAVFSLDDGFVMVWDQRQRQLHRIAMPESRRLAQDQHAALASVQRGAIEVSADDRWLAFRTAPSQRDPSYGLHLVDLQASGPLMAVEMGASGALLGNPFRWVGFGAHLLGEGDGALHRLAVPTGQHGGRWTPKAWVAQDRSAAACAEPSRRNSRACQRARERDQARRAFVPADAFLEALQVDVRSNYIASNDGRTLVVWDAYNGRPIVLDASRFPPLEVSPERPDGSDVAALYQFRPGIPLDDGRLGRPGELRFSHFGRHLVVLKARGTTTADRHVSVGAYAIPGLEYVADLNPSVDAYLLARAVSPSLHDIALCRQQPSICQSDPLHPQHDAIIAERARIESEAALRAHADAAAPAPRHESWMEPDPGRARVSAPELCATLRRIPRPIQGEPYYIDGRYAGIRVAGQGEFIASLADIPFRDGDILFDGGWCAERACSADEFAAAMRRVCESRGRGLVRAFVLEVGSAEPSRDRTWILMEKQ